MCQYNVHVIGYQHPTIVHEYLCVMQTETRDNCHNCRHFHGFGARLRHLLKKVNLLEIQKCVSFQYFNFLTAGLGNIKKI